MDTWEWGDEAIKGFAYITDIVNLQNGKFTNQTVELMRGLHKVLGEGDLFAYLVHMTLRIVEIHRVLKPTGSLYLHCDSTASHYLKLVCDSVFCAEGNGGNFLNEIIWRRGPIKGAKVTSKQYGRNADVLLLYAKGGDHVFKQPFKPYDLSSKQNKFIHKDSTGRIYSRDNPLGDYSDESIRKFEEEGRIYVTKNGKKQLIRYLDEAKGLAVGCVWDDIFEINQVASERLGYPTQKPEALLERIIKASSNEGDVVLDAYCGCGTTVAVAQRLKRRWIGIDITYQSISLILKRLEDKYPNEWPVVEANIQLDGVPRDMDSAIALANRKDDKTRKEFEKWAVLTYSKNQARINDKKGADAGIDGIAYFMIDANTNGKAVFQVKSGGADRGDIAKLNSDRLREKAEFGIFITMKSTKPMREEAEAVRKYKHPMLNREDDRIQIITIAEILDGVRINLPMGRVDTVKSAEAEGDKALQAQLL